MRVKVQFIVIAKDPSKQSNVYIVVDDNSSLPYFDLDLKQSIKESLQQFTSSFLEFNYDWLNVSVLDVSNTVDELVITYYTIIPLNMCSTTVKFKLLDLGDIISNHEYQHISELVFKALSKK